MAPGDPHPGFTHTHELKLGRFVIGGATTQES